MKKRALITGITGQDGSYLSELLLDKGYQIYGLVRRSSVDSCDRIAHIRERIQFVPGDLLDQSSMVNTLKDVRPHEVYNFAGQSFIPNSWKEPVLTGESTALGVARLLEAIRTADPQIRFYQASSSEMFGDPIETPQRETTPFRPQNPYGAAKVYGHHCTVNYREQYGLFACSGILFNHESPRRGVEFVTRKITDGVARIKQGLTHELYLGNLEARRDWGFAGDYVQAIWQMLQQDHARDYVVGTGITHSVAEFVRIAFDSVGLDWKNHVRIDSALFRPAETTDLCADPETARRELSWAPQVSFAELISMMVDHEIYRLKKGLPAYVVVAGNA